MSGEKNTAKKLVYCHCSYAKTVPEDVKAGVLQALVESGKDVSYYADLCEMSAKKDPQLAEVFSGGLGGSSEKVCIVACHKRSLKGLAHAAGQTWHEDAVTVLNMKEDSIEDIVKNVLSDERTGDTDAR